MAAPCRLQDIDVNYSSVWELLQGHPGRFNFFQAIRLLERLIAREPLGYFTGPDREVVRLRVNNALRFPVGQIESIERPESGQAQMLVNFMGLTGTAGVLPYAMTEFLLDRELKKDRTIRDFFDLFNHRMISLFYRGWEKSRFYIGYERDRKDHLSSQLLAFVGLRTDGLQNRQAISDHVLIFYSGLLGPQSRSAVALEQLLTDYFKVPVEIEQFVGSWYALQEEDQCSFREDGTLSEQLGAGVVVGDAVWDQQCRVRIKLGPLGAARYLDFLPAGKDYQPLRAITQFFGKGQVEFEVQLVLKQDEVPQCELGREDAEAPQLSWFSWLKSGRVFDRNPGDTIFFLD